MLPLTEDHRRREVRHFAYVDRDFGQVRELPGEPPARDETERHPERPPSRLRRVFLPVEDLDHRPGGATEVLRRLETEPGVVTVKIEPPLDIAVVEYDATVCGLSRLLGLLEPVAEEPSER